MFPVNAITFMRENTYQQCERNAAGCPFYYQFPDLLWFIEIVKLAYPYLRPINLRDRLAPTAPSIANPASSIVAAVGSGTGVSR